VKQGFEMISEKNLKLVNKAKFKIKTWLFLEESILCTSIFIKLGQLDEVIEFLLRCSIVSEIINLDWVGAPNDDSILRASSKQNER
jgi:hypothetical protein